VTIRPCYVGRDHSVVPDTRHHWLDGLAGLSGYGSGAALHRLYELCTSCPERTINIGSVACKGARCEMCTKIVVIVVAQIRRPLMPILKGKGKGKSPRQFIKGSTSVHKGSTSVHKGSTSVHKGSTSVHTRFPRTQGNGLQCSPRKFNAYMYRPNAGMRTMKRTSTLGPAVKNTWM
jgi:hypothetical protein